MQGSIRRNCESSGRIDAFDVDCGQKSVTNYLEDHHILGNSEL